MSDDRLALLDAEERSHRERYNEIVRYWHECEALSRRLREIGEERRALREDGK